MTFTVEPMINEGKNSKMIIGTHYDSCWPDEWTVVTQDGKRSAQFEHTILVTKNGVEILTDKPGLDKLVWNPERFKR